MKINQLISFAEGLERDSQKNVIGQREGGTSGNTELPIVVYPFWISLSKYIDKASH